MAPWLEQEEAGDWEQQTRIVTIQGQLSERNLMTLVHFYNKSMDDSHTLQWLQGCDVEPDRHLCLWYNQLAYDSEDLPTLNENPSSCTVGNSTVPHISQDLKSHCSDLLQKYLEKGKERLLRSGAQGSQTMSVSFRLLAGSLESWRCWVGREDLEYSSQLSTPQQAQLLV